MELEWDPGKAEENLRSHGVAFTEAQTVFADPLEVTIPDPDHWDGEFRFLSLGRSEADRLLVVSYTERGSRIRMISEHHEAYRRGTSVVLLDPDVAEVFKDSEAVNTALRCY